MITFDDGTVTAINASELAEQLVDRVIRRIDATRDDPEQRAKARADLIDFAEGHIELEKQLGLMVVEEAEPKKEQVH